MGNWLKTLVNETGISFCLVGLPEFAELIQVDSQIARRFPFHYQLNPLTLGTQTSPGTLYPFLKEVSHRASEIQISFSPDFDNFQLRVQIYTATKGYHAYVMSMIRESMAIALAENRNTITINDFSQAWNLGITSFISKQITNPFEMSLSNLASTLKKEYS